MTALSRRQRAKPNPPLHQSPSRRRRRRRDRPRSSPLRRCPPGRSSRGARAEADTPKPASEPAPEPALEPAPEREPYEMGADAPAKRKIEGRKGSKLAPDASKERPPARSPPGKRKKRDPNVPVVSRGETTAPGQKIRVEPLAGEKKKPRSGGGSGGGLTVAAIASNAPHRRRCEDMAPRRGRAHSSLGRIYCRSDLCGRARWGRPRAPTAACAAIGNFAIPRVVPLAALQPQASLAHARYVHYCDGKRKAS